MVQRSTRPEVDFDDIDPGTSTGGLREHLWSTSNLLAGWNRQFWCTPAHDRGRFDDTRALAGETSCRMEQVVLVHNRGRFGVYTSNLLAGRVCTPPEADFYVYRSMREHWLEKASGARRTFLQDGTGSSGARHDGFHVRSLNATPEDAKFE